MRYNRPVLLAALALITAVAVSAFYLGPPRSVFGVPSERKGDGVLNAVLGSRSVHSPGEAASQVRSAADDMTVRSFGPLPQCGDPVAMAAVVGMLREHTTVRTLGLTGAHGVSVPPKPGEPSFQHCEAKVQIEDGDYPIYYTIKRYPSSDEGWDITASAIPTRG